jgi:hypothetical protein
MPVRRLLTQARRAGAIETSGAAPLARRLAEALEVSAAGDAAVDLTHGFHTFPARMHPLTARRALALFGDLRGRTVLDPFCGSGTVLVEAHRAGARALGSDLSPLAVLVARAKCAVDEPVELVVRRAAEISERVLAEGRAARRAGGPRGRRLPDDVWRAFPPHVAAELAALRDGAEAEPESLRAPLLAILSSILVKVSHRESDTSDQTAARLVARGAAARLFAAARRGSAPGACATSRARRPGHAGAGGPRRRRATARRGPPAHGRGGRDPPPYPGTYDYADQQGAAARVPRWGAGGLAPSGEIGARRRFGAGRAEAALRGLGARHDRGAPRARARARAGRRDRAGHRRFPRGAGQRGARCLRRRGARPDRARRGAARRRRDVAAHRAGRAEAAGVRAPAQTRIWRLTAG